MLYPKPLKPHDKIALLAPCSPVDRSQIEPSIELIKSFGYEPCVYPSCFAKGEYLAGDDKSRANDINSAFANPCIKAIIAMRGGYGGARLANHLNYDIIRANPKIFCGFSDVTVLHSLINQRCQLVTFHTPMPASASFRKDLLSMGGLRDILRGCWHKEYSSGLSCISEGTACGTLTGGNLTVIASTVGTPYQLDTCGKIIFLEDVGEEAYRIDRCLLQMRDGGLFNKCRGIILGTWQDCTSEENVADILRKILRNKKIPIIGGMKCGHSVPSLSLPLGVPVIIQSGRDKCFIST